MKFIFFMCYTQKLFIKIFPFILSFFIVFLYSVSIIYSFTLISHTLYLNYYSIAPYYHISSSHCSSHYLTDYSSNEFFISTILNIYSIPSIDSPYLVNYSSHSLTIHTHAIFILLIVFISHSIHAHLLSTLEYYLI